MWQRSHGTRPALGELGSEVGVALLPVLLHLPFGHLLGHEPLKLRRLVRDSHQEDAADAFLDDLDVPDGAFNLSRIYADATWVRLVV